MQRGSEDKHKDVLLGRKYYTEMLYLKKSGIMREIRYERGDRKHSAIILVCAILKIFYFTTKTQLTGEYT